MECVESAAHLCISGEALLITQRGLRGGTTGTPRICVDVLYHVS